MKVFISHAMEHDGLLAHRLAEDLRKAGFDIWIAPDSIHSGDWVKAINQGLSECERLILLLTPAAAYSTWVNLEMSAAIILEREGRLRIVPLQVKECETPPLWRTYQAIPFVEYEVGLEELLQALTSKSVPSVERPTLRVEPLKKFALEVGVYCVTFVPDGQMLVAGLRDGMFWRWNLVKGTSTELLQAHQKTIHCVALHPNGNLLASASADHTVRLWAMPQGTLHKTLEGHMDSVRAVSFSPDGRLLASGSRDGTIRLWKVPDGILVRVLQGHEKSVYDVAFAPDGNTVASVSSDNTVRLWSAESGESTELGKLESTILSGAFSPDGKLLATGTWSGFIRLWDIVGSTKGRLLEGHNDRVHRLTFSPDGTLLLSSSKDTTIRLWNISEGKPAYSPLGLHSGWIRGLALSPDGTLIASGDTDGLIQLWRVTKQADLEEQKN